jgi:hypothetical protein
MLFAAADFTLEAPASKLSCRKDDQMTLRVYVLVPNDTQLLQDTSKRLCMMLG